MRNCPQYAVVVSPLQGLSLKKKEELLVRILSHIQWTLAEYELEEVPYIDDKYSDPL